MLPFSQDGSRSSVPEALGLAQKMFFLQLENRSESGRKSANKESVGKMKDINAIGLLLSGIKKNKVLPAEQCI